MGHNNFQELDLIYVTETYFAMYPKPFVLIENNNSVRSLISFIYKFIILKFPWEKIQ